MAAKRYFFTSESVTEGHPDKMCDQISDAVLDELIRQDPLARVACETFVTVGLVIVGGEITTKAYVDLPKLVRGLVKDIGYTDARFGFSAEGCAILNAIGTQSPDIAQGVDEGGAGDQGLMIGYACKETPELMPLPIMLAHKLCRRLTEVRKKNTLPYLGPDGKSQVTVEYEDGIPKRVDTIILASQHTEDILDSTGKSITAKSREEIKENVVKPVIGKEFLDDQTKYFINATGRFLIGGPQSDTGMTGRKIIVDSYGGTVPHGGGAFSGKDPTKVDRSATYAARYIAKNVVEAGLADKLMIQLAYVIGVADPVSIMINSFGTLKISHERLQELIRKHFQLTPAGIMEMLSLRRPIYKKTAAYGHFGRTEPDFTWERTDKAEDLKKDA
ncbi:MAG: methionine adenosyltransferase [candidate division Zixibacteria bacterium]|nr:methionine adenosyltransferase [candidate division Zixibacteria bacterium]